MNILVCLLFNTLFTDKINAIYQEEEFFYPLNGYGEDINSFSRQNPPRNFLYRTFKPKDVTGTKKDFIEDLNRRPRLWNKPSTREKVEEMIENAIDFSDVGDVDDVSDDDDNRRSYKTRYFFDKNNNEPSEENWVKRGEEEEEEIPTPESGRIGDTFQPIREPTFEQFPRYAPRTADKRTIFPRPVQQYKGAIYFFNRGGENMNDFPNTETRRMIERNENPIFPSYRTVREMRRNDDYDFFPRTRMQEVYERNENVLGNNENIIKRGMLFLPPPTEFTSGIELVRDTDLPNNLPLMNRGYESVSEDGENVFEDFSDDVKSNSYDDGAYGNKREAIPRTNHTRSTANITASLYALPANLTGFT